MAYSPIKPHFEYPPISTFKKRTFAHFSNFSAISPKVQPIYKGAIIFTQSKKESI